jgi:hypothetical protein
MCRHVTAPRFVRVGVGLWSAYEYQVHHVLALLPTVVRSNGLSAVSEEPIEHNYRWCRPLRYKDLALPNTNFQGGNTPRASRSV